MLLISLVWLGFCFVCELVFSASSWPTAFVIGLIFFIICCVLQWLATCSFIIKGYSLYVAKKICIFCTLAQQRCGMKLLCISTILKLILIFSTGCFTQYLWYCAYIFVGWQKQFQTLTTSWTNSSTNPKKFYVHPAQQRDRNHLPTITGQGKFT